MSQRAVKSAVGRRTDLNLVSVLDDLPNYSDGILLEHWVSRNDRPDFFHALRNQHAIEWIAMEPGETLEREQMVDADGEHLDTVLRQFSEHVRTGRPRKFQLARLHLDEDLPDACDA